MRFLFDSAVVGSAADVSRAKAALRRACGLLREKRTHTDGEISGGLLREKRTHTDGEKYVRREERQDVQKIQAESVRLILPANSEADLRGACV